MQVCFSRFFVPCTLDRIHFKEKSLTLPVESERSVLFIVDGGGGVKEVHGPQRGGVDGVLGIVHPEGVGDPSRIGGCNVQIGVGIGVNVNLVLALKPELFVVDADVAVLGDDDVDVGGPRGHAHYLDDRLSLGVLRGPELVLVLHRWLQSTEEKEWMITKKICEK